MSIIQEVFTPEEDLTYAAESIGKAMLASLDDLSSITVKLKEFIPSIVRGFSNGEDITKLPDFAKVTREEQVFLEHLKKINYLEMRELKAYVPAGLEVSYIEYIEALKPVVASLQRIVADVLNPYAHFLAGVVSDKRAALATDFFSFNHKEIETKRKEAYASISKCFSSTNNQETTTIAKVVGRNSDWPDIFKEVKALTTALKSVNRSTVMHLTKQCEDYLSIIHDNLHSNKLDKVTPEVANTLAQGAYQVASELEHFSIVYYRVLSLEGCISNTVDKVNSVLE